MDYLKMSLVQNKPGKEAISYTGKGYIQQTDDDFLTFKLYANETLNTDFAVSFNRLNEIKSGEVYSDDSYYTLSGIAADGTVWKTEHVLPDFDWHGQHANPIVHGKLSSITGGELLPDPKSLAMHFFEKADLPVLIREVKFTAADCAMSMSRAAMTASLSGRSRMLHFPSTSRCVSRRRCGFCSRNGSRRGRLFNRATSCSHQRRSNHLWSDSGHQSRAAQRSSVTNHGICSERILAL